jgi:hypothetical protein
MANPGAASTVTPNYVIAPQNAYRLLAYAKAVNVGVIGDTPMNMLTGCSLMCPANIVTSNSSGTTADISTATRGIYTGPSKTGTTVLTTATMASQTTQTYVKITAATNAATAIANVGTLYVNVDTAVAGGLVDVYLYGYDLS